MLARRTRFHRPWPMVLIAVIIASWAGNAAPQYKVLQTLGGANGTSPWGGVILDRSGNVYGTASGGGSGNCRYGCGTVFELIHGKGRWTESVLYSFQGGADGDGTYSGLAFDASGNLYGTTAAGGTGGWGTVFELEPGFSNWTEAVLYDFCSQSGCTDGADPTAGPIIGQGGELYGTAAGGAYGGGVIYRLTPSSGGWDESVIHSFQYSYYGHPAPGGSNPYAGLILDRSGNLYGITAKGGANCNGWSCGVVYELTRNSGGGWKEIVLHRFHNDGKDGVTPGWGALLMDNSGSLYGTTQSGGSYAGVVFKLTPKPHGRWSETILYAFKEGASGNGPNAGVVMDSVGNLYGTTDYGGSGSGCGVIYKLAPQPKGKWKYTVLYSFNGYDGCLPEGNLVLDKKGNLYGSTVLGGAGYGVVFEITP